MPNEYITHLANSRAMMVHIIGSSLFLRDVLIIAALYALQLA